MSFLLRALASRKGTGLLPPVPRPQNDAYPARPVVRTVPPVRKVWTAGALLDQDGTGACGAFSVVGEYLAEPVADHSPARLGNAYALNHYRRAAVLAGLDPDTDPGSYLWDNLQVGVDRGMWDEYRWCASMSEVRDALITEGPVVIAIPWYRSMSDTQTDQVRVNWNRWGGGYHATLLIGYDPDHTFTVGHKWVREPRKPSRRRRGRKPGRRYVLRRRPITERGEGYLIRNSWGDMWGQRVSRRLYWKGTGDAWIRGDDLERLLATGYGWGSSAAVPIRRHAVDLAALLEQHPDPRTS